MKWDPCFFDLYNGSSSWCPLSKKRYCGHIFFLFPYGKNSFIVCYVVANVGNVQTTYKSEQKYVKLQEANHWNCFILNDQKFLDYFLSGLPNDKKYRVMNPIDINNNVWFHIISQGHFWEVIITPKNGYLKKIKCQFCRQSAKMLPIWGKIQLLISMSLRHENLMILSTCNSRAIQIKGNC